MIKEDPRMNQLLYPVGSLCFALALAGSDLSGGFQGIGASTFFNSFLRYPVDILVQDEPRPQPLGPGHIAQAWPSLSKAKEYLKAVYFCKHEKAIAKWIVDSQRLVAFSSNI